MNSSDTVISLAGLEKKDKKRHRQRVREAEEASLPRDGWDDILDASPNSRTIFHRVSYPPRLSLNGLLISLLSTLLLVFIGFIAVSLPSPLNLSRLGQPELATHTAMMRYTFQLPLILLIGAFLGPFMGTLSILLFLGLGLFVYPVFANGGGLAYIFQPGFGYLLGGLLAALIAGRKFHKAFQREDRRSRSWKLLQLALATMLTIHVSGIVFMTALAVLGQIPWGDLSGWILRLSVEPLPYDMLATFVFFCLVRQIRLSLWLVLY